MIRRQAEVPHDVSVGALADVWHEHVRPLVEARHGIGVARPAGKIAGHAVSALVVGEVLAARVLAARWVTVVDALIHGASTDDVGAALGLDLDEIVIGLCSWADAQHGHGLMTSAEHARVIGLVGR